MPVTQNELDAKKALNCLYLDIDSGVADDINSKVNAFIYELQDLNQQLKNELAHCLDVIDTNLDLEKTPDLRIIYAKKLCHGLE